MFYNFNYRGSYFIVRPQRLSHYAAGASGAASSAGAAGASS